MENAVIRQNIIVKCILMFQILTILNLIPNILFSLLNHLDVPLEEPTSIECTGKECGSPCSEGVCDGNGFCTSPEYNLCVVHGCSEKKCGDACLSGDISGVCDAEGECNFDVDSVTLGGQCGKFNICYNPLSNWIRFILK